MPQETLERLRETFRRLSTSSGYLPQATFIRDVLGESVPAKLADVSFIDNVLFGWGCIMLGLIDDFLLGHLHCLWWRWKGYYTS